MEDLVAANIADIPGIDAITKEVFEGKKVFITGHTGFKGSWLSIFLYELGARLTGFSLAPPTSPSNFIASEVRDLIATHIEADIRDKDKLKAALLSCKPDFVFHLAAQPLVYTSYVSPLETWDINVLGTANVLDSLRLLKTPCTVIIVTSDKCYEANRRKRAYKEDDRLGGYDLYSASKAACELLVEAYRSSFFNSKKMQERGIKISTVRAGNVIGGGDWANYRLIPDIVKCISQGKSVPIRHPDAIRPWQHVLEPLAGYLKLAAFMDSKSDEILCSSWNFGPNQRDAIKVSEVVEIFCEEWGGNCKWHYVGAEARRHESPVLRLNIGKALKELDWRPRWDLRQALRKTAAWYRTYYQSPFLSMLEVSRADIRSFLSTLLR